MSIQTEIDRIITAVQEAHEKVAEKGGTTAQPYLVANLASAIDSIPDASDPVLQEKTVTPKTSAQSVTPDSGYDGLSKVTVNAMPTATQATPSISVNSSGLITASATQTAGYVAAGTKSATKQLTTQAAKTITPSTSSQTAVAAGRYTTGAVTVAAIPSTYVKPTATKAATTYTPNTSNQTIAAGTYCSGAQTIKGDANLVAGNIKSGVSIFGVAGTHEGGVTPTGTLEITENGTYDVTQYANASVNVTGSGGGGSIETCSLTINDPMWQIATFCYQSASGEAVRIDADPMTPASGTYEIVCGSIFYIDGVSSYSASCNGCEQLAIYAYVVTAGAGESATIDFS